MPYNLPPTTGQGGGNPWLMQPAVASIAIIPLAAPPVSGPGGTQGAFAADESQSPPVPYMNVNPAGDPDWISLQSGNTT